MRCALLLSLVLVCGCATAGGRRLEIAGKFERARVDAESHLAYDLVYSIGDFQAGEDRVVARFRTRDGGTWKAAALTLSRPQGRVTVTLSGAEILEHTELSQPYRFVFVLDRGDRSGRIVTLATTDEVVVERATRPQTAGDYKLLPPTVGSGQIISDILHDPCCKPAVPRELNVSGARYWGIYKICVGTDGHVQDVAVIRSAGFTVDASWRQLIHNWQYRPYTLSGRPVPFCHPMRIEVRSQ